jgi:hypothetical protein
MISSTLFPSEHALDGTKLPLIITPLKSGTKPATSSSNNGGANLSKLPTPNAKELARSPVPPNSPKRGKQPATVSGGKNGTNLAPGSSLAPASAKAPRNCLGAQLATWSEGGAPVYTYEVITRNGKPMIEAALKNRPWWGPCKTSWEQDDQCTFFFYPYNRTDDRAILRSRGKADPARLRLWNHVEWNKWLTSKKGLYFSLREYCEISLSEGKGSAEDAAPSGGVTKQQYALDELVPATYYVQGTGDSDEEMQRFTAHVERLKVSADDAAPIADTKNRNYWIVKPAAGSNQGDGIRVLGGDDVAAQVRTIIESGGEDGVQGGRGGHRGWRQFGWIVQKYIERPLLVHGRKFDLRCYVLLVLERPKEETKSRLGKKKEPREAMRLPHHSDGLTAFLYDEGYVRTSSAPYSLDPAALSNIAAHLTNDAVQKQFEGEYGKHEAANKLDFKQFQAYTSKHHGVRSDYVQKVLIPTLREYVKISVAAASQVGRRWFLSHNDGKLTFYSRNTNIG